jgi:hypothetical protein
MKTIKIYDTDWVLPLFYESRQVIVHLNPHKGTDLIGNKWLYCVTLNTDKTPAIIRLSNLRDAKKCCKVFDSYLTVNKVNIYDLTRDNLELLLKFRDFVTSYVVTNNIKCFIKRT